MLKYLVVIVILFGVITMNSTLVAGADSRDEVVERVFLEEQEARKLAESYFLEMTEGRIEKYEIILQQEWRRWGYFITGTAEFKLPANNWIVEVDGITGEIVILGGEGQREKGKALP